jgi:hypothetical protein
MPADRPGTDRPLQGPPAVPRWVKVTGIVLAVLVALLLVAHLTGLTGSHGPGSHLSGGRSPGPGTAPSVLLAASYR